MRKSPMSERDPTDRSVSQIPDNGRTEPQDDRGLDSICNQVGHSRHLNHVAGFLNVCVLRFHQLTSR